MSRTTWKCRGPTARARRRLLQRRTMCSSASILRPRRPRLKTAADNFLVAKGLTGNPGLEVGRKVAEQIIPLRRLDPVPLPPAFNGGTAPGQWRPTNSFISVMGNPPVPAPFSPMLVPWLASFNPLTLTGPARFRAGPPPALTSARYTRDYNEVKAFGSFGSTARTPEQTDLAYFWSGAWWRNGIVRCAVSPPITSTRQVTVRGSLRSRTWPSRTR